jgi:arylsulfatase A-like enzyme
MADNRVARSVAAALAVILVSACGSTQSSPTASGAPPPGSQAAAPAPTAAPTRSPSPTPYEGVPVETIAAQPDGRKRNILLIIADDFGIDLSPCNPFGGDKPRMPNLERMCDEGLVFDTVWVSPLCTPTRATLLTGQYGFRTNVVQVGDVLQDTDSVMDGLARVDPAYANALVGKWHVTDTDPPDLNAPAHFGVQHYAGFLSGFTDDFFSWDSIEDGTPGHADTYTATWMTDKALDWVGQQGDQPWFLWLAENEPHFPFHLPPPSLQHYTDLSGDQADVDAHPRAYVKAMAEALDTEMGRLLASLDPEVRANTTVIFVGDNGSDPDVVSDPYGTGHGKFSIYEGGIRVPLVVAGAGVSRRGEREDALVEGVDIPATILALAGATPPTFHDGVSFAPALTDSAFGGRDYLYMDAIRAEPFEAGRPGWTARNADYKLIEYDDGGRELYDTHTDIAEHHNLVAGGVPADLKVVYDALDAYGRELRASRP